MDLKSELLKSIWYAFTSLEAERSGKVSKSQLKVLSHNLYTALNIPHDPVALEEHFKDNDNGPVSDHGYMPYLNKYILAKATEGTFNKETFDDLCWMMTAKKNFKPSIHQGVCSQRDCFKLFCLFNLLSEDHYPLVIIPPELEYLLKKISTAMNQEWDGKALEDLLSSEPSLQDGLSVWMFLEHLSAGHLMRVENNEAFSLALDEIFMEMYHNVLKKGFMLKKGHVRRSWHERWFVLKPGSLAYYIGEDQKDKKGEIQLDRSCVVETMPDKEGRRCLFCVKTPGRTYEMSASDQKQRVEWFQAVQTALRLKTEGKSSVHQELKLRRRELRENSHDSQKSESQSSQSSQKSECQSSQSGQKSECQGSQSGEKSECQSSQSGQRSECQSSQSGQRSECQSSLSAQGSECQSSQSAQGSECQSSQSAQGSECQSSQSCQRSESQLSQSVQRSMSQSSQNQQRSLSQSIQSGQRSLSQSSQGEHNVEVEEPGSVTQDLEPENMEPDLEIIDIIQQHLEIEVQRKKEDAWEKEKQKKKQQELERQLQEANKARENMVGALAKMEREVQQQKERIQDLEITQQKLEQVLHTQIQARLEEEKIRHELERLLEEERRKMAELILHQTRLETLDCSETTQEKKSKPQKDENVLPPNPQETTCQAQALTETVETQQYNMEKMTEKFSKAPHLRQWNVQLNCLMKPITPADKVKALSVRTNYPKHGHALTSTEFIVKCQSTIPETESSNSQLQKGEEDVGTQEQVTASLVEEPEKNREQVKQSKDFA